MDPIAAILLHQTEDFKDLLEIVTNEQEIREPVLVEKDYWLMHVLYGLKNLEFEFYLKGGTSLSKGFGCINRFSEDIDIRIEPHHEKTKFKVYIGKNHNDSRQKKSRKDYYEWLAQKLRGAIPGIVNVERDENFDDDKYRGGGIRLFYKSRFNSLPELKEGILLEVGFDTITPNGPCNITSWAYDKAVTFNKVKLIDNRAMGVHCYEPRYTFVEKLQAVLKKFDQYKNGKNQGLANFIRHYYDIYQLLDRQDVQSFIGTPDYNKHKKERFGNLDNRVVNSSAFKLDDKNDRGNFEKEYNRSVRPLCFREPPTFTEILERIGNYLERL